MCWRLRGPSQASNGEDCRCCKINFASSIDGVKSPNGSKTEDIKLSKPLFDDENDFMAAFILNVSLSEFHSIPKALSNGILSKSRLTD